MPRIYEPAPLHAAALHSLSPQAARHVQVLRMQPGHGLTLFNGQGGEFAATITEMGRSHVQVCIGAHDPVERENSRAIHIAIGMPANERMDYLVEKATEMGVASIQPLMTERSVLRLEGERADKKVAHWQATAVAACEQSGRNRVPVVHPVAKWSQWLTANDNPGYILSFKAGGTHLHDLVRQLKAQLAAEIAPETRAVGAIDGPPSPAVQTPCAPLGFLCGPEGGLSAAEESAALARGWQALSLGARVLRSETAPLVVLAQF